MWGWGGHHQPGAGHVLLEEHVFLHQPPAHPEQALQVEALADHDVGGVQVCAHPQADSEGVCACM